MVYISDTAILALQDSSEFYVAYRGHMFWLHRTLNVSLRAAKSNRVRHAADTERGCTLCGLKSALTAIFWWAEPTGTLGALPKTPANWLLDGPYRIVWSTLGDVCYQLYFLPVNNHLLSLEYFLLIWDRLLIVRHSASTPHITLFPWNYFVYLRHVRNRTSALTCPYEIDHIYQASILGRWDTDKQFRIC
jgi:hypothetical protein